MFFKYICRYCNAHMQVMGFLPKKERKKKPEAMYFSDSENNGLHTNYVLTNGHSDDSKPGKSFSASKLFPELAEKLSLDNHSSIAQSLGGNNGTSSAELMESVIKDGVKTSLPNKSPSKQASSSSAPRRPKKQTRKSLSILRKKRLGLLTDEESRSMFSSSGCQAYNHYARWKAYSSDLLTPVVDSSEDELDSALTYCRLLTTHNLRNTDAPSAVREHLPSSAPKTDLTAEAIAE